MTVWLSSTTTSPSGCVLGPLTSLSNPRRCESTKQGSSHDPPPVPTVLGKGLGLAKSTSSSSDCAIWRASGEYRGWDRLTAGRRDQSGSLVLDPFLAPWARLNHIVTRLYAQPFTIVSRLSNGSMSSPIPLTLVLHRGVRSQPQKLLLSPTVLSFVCSSLLHRSGDTASRSHLGLSD
jgi:hypothetical protein